jgi:hypothetical protein
MDSQASSHIMNNEAAAAAIGSGQRVVTRRVPSVIPAEALEQMVSIGSNSVDKTAIVGSIMAQQVHSLSTDKPNPLKARPAGAGHFRNRSGGSSMSLLPDYTSPGSAPAPRPAALLRKDSESSYGGDIM